VTRHGTGSETRTVRASPAEWREWERLAAADGMPLNRWLRRAVNDRPRWSGSLRGCEPAKLRPATGSRPSSGLCGRSCCALLIVRGLAGAGAGSASAPLRLVPGETSVSEGADWLVAGLAERDLHFCWSRVAVCRPHSEVPPRVRRPCCGALGSRRRGGRRGAFMRRGASPLARPGDAPQRRTAGG
jgi:hypothetical protein